MTITNLLLVGIIFLLILIIQIQRHGAEFQEQRKDYWYGLYKENQEFIFKMFNK